MTKILKNKKYKRILELSDDALQITTLDSRFYRRHGKYYPSITHVLSVFPKGPHKWECFLLWVRWP